MNISNRCLLEYIFHICSTLTRVMGSTALAFNDVPTDIIYITRRSSPRCYWVLVSPIRLPISQRCGCSIFISYLPGNFHFFHDQNLNYWRCTLVHSVKGWGNSVRRGQLYFVFNCENLTVQGSGLMKNTIFSCLVMRVFHVYTIIICTKLIGPWHKGAFVHI